MDPVKPAYQGEAQLVRWAESAAAGRTVTLRIDEDDVQHAFKGLKCGDQGQRLHVVVMLVDDNEELQDPETAKRRGHKAPTKPKPAEPLPSGAPAPERSESTQNTSVKRSNLAAIKCKEDKEFQQWLWAEGIKAGLPSRKTMAPLTDAEHSDMVLKELLGITSKKELDVPGPAQDAFDKLMTDYDMRSFAR